MPSQSLASSSRRALAELVSRLKMNVKLQLQFFEALLERHVVVLNVRRTNISTWIQHVAVPLISSKLADLQNPGTSS